MWRSTSGSSRRRRGKVRHLERRAAPVRAPVPEPFATAGAVAPVRTTPLGDRWALQVDMRDHIFSYDLLNVRQNTQNLELTTGIAYYF